MIERGADQAGIRTFDRFIPATQASSGKVQIMCLGYLGIDTFLKRSAISPD
jgi:hypothetical protein